MERLNAIANALSEWVKEKQVKKPVAPEEAEIPGEELPSEAKATKVKAAFNKKLNIE